MKSSKPSIGEIRGWSDLEGEAGRKECEEYLAEHPELKQEGWKACNLQGTNLHGCWVVGR